MKTSTIIASTTFILGALLGGVASGGSEEQPAETASPAPVETVTEYVTERPKAAATTKTVEVTPEACLEALDHARDGFLVSSEMADMYVDVLDLMMSSLEEAITYGDVSQESVDRMNSIASRSTDLGNRAEALAPKFITAAIVCEG